MSRGRVFRGGKVTLTFNGVQVKGAELLAFEELEEAIEEEQEETTMMCRCNHPREWHDNAGDCEMCDCARFVEVRAGAFPSPPAYRNPNDQRSRFEAIAEELEDRAAPLKKPANWPNVERPRVPRLFQETIVIQTEPDGSVSVTPCPRCGTGAFTPNVSTTEVICRGCPLPAPVFACDTSGVRNSKVIGNPYRCDRCGKRSSVTLTLSEVNLYCTGCGKLTIHSVEELRPRGGSKEASFFKSIVPGVTIVTDERVEKGQAVFAQRRPGETDAQLRERVQDAITERDLSRAYGQDVATVINEINQRAAEIAGMSAEVLFGTSPDIITHTGMVDLFRTMLGLENFTVFAARIRNQNVVERQLKERDWDRRTGRTTKAMLEVLAWVRIRNDKLLLVLGSSEAQDRELMRMAADLKSRLDIKGQLSIAPMPRNWPNGIEGSDRDTTSVYIDHHFREIGRRGYSVSTSER